jgi:anthranilate synthase/aminodeoxychorismate synthase-like glutamine amidotransferase
LGEEVIVYRNDKIKISDIQKMQPTRIIVSPGPSIPNQAGISNEVILEFGEKIPILGVCLGHQCIGYSYGARIIKANQIMHGKLSQIHHNGKGLFKNLPNPFSAVRYHSLVVDRKTLSPKLEIVAWTDDDTIMGIHHRDFPLDGVQFHPESFMTGSGKKLFENFLNQRGQEID